MFFNNSLFTKYNIELELKKKFKIAAEKKIGELYTATFFMTSNKKNAYKLFAECLEDAVKFLPHLDEKIDIDRWLFRILINKIRTKYSLNSYSVDYEKIESKFCKIIDWISGKKEIDEKIFSIKSNQIKDLISNLPADLKMSLLLNDILGKTFKEASDIIDMPVDVMALRINYARKFFFIAGSFHQNNIYPEQEKFNYESEILIAKLVEGELNDSALRSNIKKLIDENKKIELSVYIQTKIKQLLSGNKDEFLINLRTKDKLLNLLN